MRADSPGRGSGQDIRDRDVAAMPAIDHDGHGLAGLIAAARWIGSRARAGVDLGLKIHHADDQYTGMPSVASAKNFWRRSRSRVVRETATDLGGSGNDGQGRTITAGS
jgi:hypothetical protein